MQTQSFNGKNNNGPLLAPTGLVGAVMVEGSEKDFVQDVLSRDPRLVLQAMPLPVREVLESSAPLADVQDFPNGVRRRTIHDPNPGNWLDPRDLEDGMDPHQSRKPQPPG